ncbi:MAG: DUF3052 domain-containing protein [Terriglobales bacterium]|jgi:hypothetical protein
MAGYSGTPLLKKIGIKSGHRVVLVNMPRGFREELGPLPDGAQVVKDGEAVDVILLFAKNQEALLTGLPAFKPKLAQAGMLWAAWPKRASGVATDLAEGLVRRVGLSQGLVDIKVCAINDIWSGLKFVIPVKDRKQ